MYPDALAPATVRGLATLKQLPEIHDLYLGGGTAVALHLGHRLSVDLDFFSGLPIDTLALRQHLSQLGTFQLEAESRGTLHGVLDGAKVTFFDDAEADPMPKMLKPMPWNDVKTFFTQESPRCIAFLGT